MSYTVVWAKQAEARLAQAWLDARLTRAKQLRKRAECWKLR
jgi:hypothetical protein